MGQISRITQADIPGIGKEAILIDVREPGEFAGSRLPGSLNVPLSRLSVEASRLPKDKPIIILCQRGGRAQDAARKLQSIGFADLRILDGGLQCCSGLEKGSGGAWAMERQVRMAAGSLVLLGMTLAWLVHPLFLLLSAGVGARLIFSAATDTCGMAAVLARMPWNRHS